MLTNLLITLYIITPFSYCSLVWPVENTHSWKLRIFNRFIPHQKLGNKFVITNDSVEIRNVSCVLEIDQGSYIVRGQYNLSLSLFLNGVELTSELVTKFWQYHEINRFINGNYDRRLFNIGYNEDTYGHFLKIVDNGTIQENDQLECKATWNGGSLVETWNATLFVEDPTLATCHIRIDNHVNGTIIHKITAPNYAFKMDPNQEVLWTLDEFGNRIFVTPTYVHTNADVYIECSASKNYVELSFFKGEDLINQTDFYEGHGTFYMVRRGMNSENKPTVTIFFQKFSPNHVGHYSLRAVSMDEDDQEKTFSMLHFYFALPVKPKIVYNRVVAFSRNQTDLSSIPPNVVTKLRLFEIEDGFLFICRADGWQPLKVSWHIKKFGTNDYTEINAEFEEKSFINKESYLTIEFSRNMNSTIPVKCIASNDHGTDVRIMKASYESGLVQIIESESDEDDIQLNDDESWKSCVCANNGIDFSVYTK